jgi:phosphoglycerate kinase
MLHMEQLAAENKLDNKRVIIRVDLNVPIQNSQVQNDSRIRAILPTLKMALSNNARIILLSHLGQPKTGDHSEAFSLKPVAERLEKLLKHPIRFEKNWLEGIEIAPKEIVLCENVRFNPGEMENDPTLAKKMAALGDIFIMDAFGTAHRAQASTVGIAEYAPIAAAGLLLTKELAALEQALKKPHRPLLAIVGGAKVSSKLPILKSLIQLADILILGGGIANTFIAAKGYDVGQSLYEANLIPEAKQLIETAKANHKILLIPNDVIVTKELSETAQTRISPLEGIETDEKIADVGPASLLTYSKYIKEAGTILWNGPLGIFELKPFSEGTENLAHAIANSQAFSIAGGGETLAAIDKYEVAPQLSYISTGGGAFLEYLEGKTLPAVALLEKRAISPQSTS